MNKNFYKKYSVVFVVVIGVIFFNNYLADNFLQKIFYRVVSKPGVFLNNKLFVLSRFSRGFLETQKIIDENAKLEEESNFLRGELTQLESLKRENQFLRDELGVARRLDMQLAIVRIFNIQRGAISSTALINKGLQDGIAKLMPLIAAGNILVGVVDQVFDNSAAVLLLDDPRVKISGRIKDSRTLISTEGNLQNRLGLKLVAADDDIKTGDVVVTSGLDGFPESLPIAKVTEIGVSSGALFKDVTAQPLFDLSLGSNLFVILK